MITSFDARKVAPDPRGSVLSLGVFDGVHLGHRATLEANVRRARELDAVSTVLTFRRHPKLVLLGRAPRTITTLEHRIELFRRLGIGHVVALPFDEELRSLPAEEFTRRFLIEALGARAFVLGFDSKFGHDRGGGPELLRRMGLPVEVVGQVLVDGRAVSSTALREAIELGDLAGAERMLGRAPSVLGRVVRGDGRGAGLGFPTANLDLHGELHPPPGVYACLAHRIGAEGRAATYAAVANLGQRPTLEAIRGGEEGARAAVVEAHLLDFSGDLYGQQLELEFLERLRAEKRFASLAELAAQIQRDVQSARELLAGRTRRGTAGSR